MSAQPQSPPVPPPASAATAAASSAVAPPLDARQHALARLQASRQRLQTLWVPPPPADSGKASRGPHRVAAWVRHWRRQLGDNPVAGLVMQAVDSWWQRNPWRQAGEAMAGELRQSILPIVRRHPVATVGLAAVAGAALIAARPWRWPLVARQLRPLPGHAGRWLLARLGQAPWQSIIAGLVLARGMTGSADGADGGVAGDTERERRAASANDGRDSGDATDTASPSPAAARVAGSDTLH